MSNQTRVRRLQLFDGLLGTLPKGRTVDLGTGHGMFAMRAADLGWDVTAVDARDERFPVDDRVTWVRQDIREFDLASFDLILCLGLWYHLTAADQQALLKRMAGTPVIIDTHLATGGHIDSHERKLSKPVTVDGYRGRMYSERGWDARPTASWGNDDSFWPTRKAFLSMLAEHGYPVVYAGIPWVTPDRTFFQCLPQR